jgi:hypothetical protein
MCRVDDLYQFVLWPAAKKGVASARMCWRIAVCVHNVCYLPLTEPVQHEPILQDSYTECDK